MEGSIIIAFGIFYGLIITSITLAHYLNWRDRRTSQIKEEN
ncbi:hypothetical protein [Cytobacillus oceanisediminis]|nr:hypothetical protein [Cytobacillus oceanisediminis]